jgi:hypothetical protein
LRKPKRGYDAEQLRPRSRRGRPPIGSEAAALFQVRLEPELREALATAARGEHTSPSEMTRRALRTYLQEIEVSPESKGEPRKARQSGLRNRGVRVERWRRSDPRVRGPCRSWVSLISEYSCAGLILLERELSFLD